MAICLAVSVFVILSLFPLKIIQVKYTFTCKTWLNTKLVLRFTLEISRNHLSLLLLLVFPQAYMSVLMFTGF